MKVTQAISFQHDSIVTGVGQANAPQNLPKAGKAVLGGGWITTPAVAAHLRKNTSVTNSRIPQDQSSHRRAVTGGGWITTPAVAAHVRKNMTTANRRSI
jgi:hypothetical protein